MTLQSRNCIIFIFIHIWKNLFFWKTRFHCYINPKTVFQLHGIHVGGVLVCDDFRLHRYFRHDDFPREIPLHHLRWSGRIAFHDVPGHRHSGTKILFRVKVRSKKHESFLLLVKTPASYCLCRRYLQRALKVLFSFTEKFKVGVLQNFITKILNSIKVARWLALIWGEFVLLLVMGNRNFQMIMGGRKVELSPEEHIFASIQLFLDVIYIFWMLLSLFGNKWVCFLLLPDFFEYWVFNFSDD